MKNIALIFSIILMGFSANATSFENENNTRRGYDGNAYIFVEGDVEFSIFPDGQFDFVYIGPQKGSQVTINSRDVNVSFNSGYDYDAFVQYDDYGAVIQVETVPIYYDEYGRIAQAGNVDIRYNNRRIVRVGGLHVIYNNHGYYSHVNGAINSYNPYYVYRPWHVYYARPIFSHCIVYDMPYRRYYSPVRYSYHHHVVYYKNRHNVAYHNTRRDFYNPGSRVYDKRGRSSINKNYDPNRKNTMIASSNGRTNNTLRNNITRGNDPTRSNTRSNTTIRNSSTNSKGAATIDRNTRNSENASNMDTNIPVRNENTNNNIRANNSQNNVRNTPAQGTVRANNTGNTRTVSTNKTVQRQTRNISTSNRSSSVTRSKTPAPRRETTSRSTVNKSSAPSRSSSQTNTSRGSSSREASSSRGRG